MKLPNVKSARLILRPFCEADIAKLHTLWTDAAIRKYLWDDEVISLETAASVVNQSIECAARHGIGMWSVSLKGADEIIGFCGFRFIGETSDVELLYALFPQYWNQGLATEAAHALLTFIFSTTSFEKILAGADAPNAKSFELMRRLGMRPLNKSVASVPNAIYYAIERTDFVSDSSVEWHPDA